MAISKQLFTRIRIATVRDVPHLHKLIHELAVTQRLSDICSATESALSSTLFPTTNNTHNSSFSSVTIFLVETSSTPFPSEENGNNHPHDFAPILKNINIEKSIDDTKSEIFRSSNGDNKGDVVVAGFVLFYPHYSTFLAKPGFYVEDLYVRECYRSNGLGRMLLSAVAKQAAKMLYGRVEWSVADFNVDAIKFYTEKMHAQLLPEWRTCRLTGEVLQNYANADI